MLGREVVPPAVMLLASDLEAERLIDFAAGARLAAREEYDTAEDTKRICRVSEPLREQIHSPENARLCLVFGVRCGTVQSQADRGDEVKENGSTGADQLAAHASQSGAAASH
jgi:hypothetical protein